MEGFHHLPPLDPHLLTVHVTVIERFILPLPHSSLLVESYQLAQRVQATDHHLHLQMVLTLAILLSVRESG